MPIVDRLQQDTKRRQLSKSSNEKIRLQKEIAQVKTTATHRAGGGVGVNKTPEQFYREQLEYREKVEMDIEFKRFMDEIETKRRYKESQPRANRRSNEIIQEYARQHSRGIPNHQQQQVHQRLYKNVSLLQPNNHSRSFIGLPN